jgi:AcrR family transcriptional regulator
MAPRGETRGRMVSTAAELFRRQGYHGTGLNQILDESRAPRGSLYFHFPGGKQQLAIEAVSESGQAIGAGIDYLLETSVDVGEAIAGVVAFLAEDLRSSDFERGCPVGTVALDAASSSPSVRLACSDIFDQWLGHIQRKLQETGWTKRQAADEAMLVIAAIEGALLLARARRDTEPLDAVAKRLRSSLASPPPKRRNARHR